MKLSLGLTPRDYSVAGGAVAYDADALAYFTANTAITSDADKNAINTFYLGLKSDGIYTKIKAMYLPIWGSASSCKWNLVNPVDSNPAFRLTFHGTSWAFSSSGMTPTNAYADTFLAPTAMGQDSIHGSSYLRNNTTTDGPAFSTEDAGTLNNAFYLFPKITTSNNYSVRINDSTSAFLSQTNNIRGLNIINRIASNSKKYRINNTEVFSLTTASTGRNTQSIYIAKLRTTNTYFTNEYSFLSFGDGLTDAEASNFYTRVNTLMTYFGINV
jgi:hypothetical protein